MVRSSSRSATFQPLRHFAGAAGFYYTRPLRLKAWPEMTSSRGQALALAPGCCRSTAISFLFPAPPLPAARMPDGAEDSGVPPPRFSLSAGFGLRIEPSALGSLDLHDSAVMDDDVDGAVLDSFERLSDPAKPLLVYLQRFCHRFLLLSVCRRLPFPAVRLGCCFLLLGPAGSV